MFGYANKETEDYLPLPIYLSHVILLHLAKIRKEGKKMTYLRPDSKSQVTVEYDENNKAIRIDTIVVSTQHDDFDTNEQTMLDKIKNDVKTILIPEVVETLTDDLKVLFQNDFTLHVNPTGKFVIGGPHGDTGLTGRKIIVDTYGGRGAHGGGAFSGKDPSKVDRSAAYASRHIAKNLVAAGVADEILIQLAYAIGVAEPVGVYVNTYGTSNIKMSDSEIAKKVKKLFDLRPGHIEKNLKLRNPMYSETAAYGHMGRTPRTVKKHFNCPYLGEKHIEVELFTWEKLDRVDDIKNEFQI
jgi:S-adenosylmethionine synthetase